MNPQIKKSSPGPSPGQLPGSSPSSSPGAVGEASPNAAGASRGGAAGPASAPPRKGAEEELIRGTVIRITYRSESDDYRVVKVIPEGPIDRRKLTDRGEIVLVGDLPGIEIGQEIEAGGKWASHERHGPQFRAAWYKPELPKGIRGIEAFLQSGAIRGVGPVIARRIVEAFGRDTFKVLDEDISRLRSIKGITRKRFDEVGQSWADARAGRELVSFLGDHGIAASWAYRLRKIYGRAALSKLRANPYRLIADLRGVGFGRADLIARKMGLPEDSPDRVRAGLIYILESQAGDGHTYVEEESLIERATGLLEVPGDLVVRELQALEEKATVHKLPTTPGDAPEDAAGDAAGDGARAGAGVRIFLQALYEAETSIASHLRRIRSHPRKTPKIGAEKFVRSFEERFRLTLAEKQRDAVGAIASEGLLILTGGPGTGKTTTLRAVYDLFIESGLTVKMAAPTGRAARRLSEATHGKAETIHRLLAFNPHKGTFAHDSSDPIEAHLVIVDEASMLDVVLASSLLEAIRDGTCLMIVGDRDQLPSVGPGNFLHDFIASGLFPVCELDRIFRQAESSLIVVNAHRINQGEFPLLEDEHSVENPDFFLIERDDPQDIADTICKLVAERIPKKFGLDPIRDIQVLSPMRRGPLGVEAFNQLLQTALNPARGTTSESLGESGGASGGELPRESPSVSGEEEIGDPSRGGFRVGDRVMQTVNDYDRDVSNGDIGLIERIGSGEGDAGSEDIIVRFGQRAVAYQSEEARQLRLAYAVTIHKAQGSEYPAVVIPLHMQQFVMLQRNLIYTAVTRGKRLVCIVGSKRALGRAIGNTDPLVRNSALGLFLRG